MRNYRWKRLLGICILSLTVQKAPLHGQGVSSATTVAFYRLRIELTTNSGWTSFVVKYPATVYTIRQMEVIGQPSGVSITADKITIVQPLENALANESVGVVFDLAFAADAVSSGLQFGIGKGCITGDGTSVKISLVTESEVRSIGEFRHDGCVSDYPNVVDFELDTSSLMNISPPQVQNRTSCQRMLWALYYQWYTANWWTSNSQYLKDHPAESYVSSDLKAIARQIDQAKSAGVDGFLCSWLGPDDSVTDQNFKGSSPFLVENEHKPQAAA